jgi:type III restriction enzyme
VYRLTPYEAYRQRLVKQIEVAGMVKDNDASRVFLRLDALRSERHTVTARIAIHRLLKTGKVQEVVVEVKPGTSLQAKSGMDAYAGYEVDEINISGGFVRFANNIELRSGDSVGGDQEAIFRAQISYTIEEHFRKQERLRKAGIKVLSLFFIDRVSNYAGSGVLGVDAEGGVIRQIFDDEFNRLKGKYLAWREVEPARVQAAYFAQKRKGSSRNGQGGEVELLDSVSGKTREDEAAFDLIMRDKEALLSFPTAEDDDESRRRKQVSFIFSHSALREGWDNPNVFQICTLHQTVSEIKKRQEIGRGIRLCVDQTGERVHDETMNILTVVANSSYGRYVEGLQAEIEADYGQGAQSPRIGDGRKPKAYHKKPGVVLTPVFRQLWERIKQKTRYTVAVDSERLITEVSQALSDVRVLPPQISVAKGHLVVAERGNGRDTFEAQQLTSTKVAQTLRRNGLPNLINLIENLMQQTTNPVRISRGTLYRILVQAPDKQAMLDNPFEFATQAVALIKEKLLAQLVGGIQYEECGEWYELSQLDDEVQTTKPLIEALRSVYDMIPYDADNEANFVRGLERRDDVKVYLKLPNWFKVETPVGDYNPDWAIAIEDRDEHNDTTGLTLYMVAETKSTLDRTKLRPTEALKIQCGSRHFQDTLKVQYCVVADADKLPCC